MEIENISYKRTLVDLASLSPQSNQSQINSPSCQLKSSDNPLSSSTSRKIVVVSHPKNKPKNNKNLNDNDNTTNINASLNESSLVSDKQWIQKEYSYSNIQLYFNLKNNLEKTFFIPGDFMVNLDYNDTRTAEEQINIYKQLKKVASAEQDNVRNIVILNIYTSESIKYCDFNELLQGISKYPDPFISYFLPVIEKYYQNIAIYGSIQRQLLKTLGRNKLEQIMLRRRKYFDEYVDTFLKEHFNEQDFFVYYKYQSQPKMHRIFNKEHKTNTNNDQNIHESYNSTSLDQILCADQCIRSSTSSTYFDNCSENYQWMEYSTAGVSYSLIALLGTDPSSFVNISMRNGFLDFSSDKSKYEAMIKSLANRVINVDLEMFCDTLEEVVLLTLDDYSIATTQQVYCINLKYPEELKLGFDGKELPTDIPIFIKYNIDLNSLACIIEKRRKNPAFQSQWENEIFGYTIESQVFLEKYYQDKLRDLKPENVYDHVLKHYYNKECGYRMIQQ